MQLGAWGSKGLEIPQKLGLFGMVLGIRFRAEVFRLGSRQVFQSFLMD